MTNLQTYEEVMINAFVHTALIKRYIGALQTERMKEMIRERKLRTIDDMRNWLQTGEGMSPNLASALKKILPPKDKEVLGDYKILTHLADGGMGSVWMAVHPRDNEMVVVKTLKANLSTASEEFGLRFEREAQIMEQLKHDNTVWCLDAATAADGTHFMVLEFIENGDLKDLTEQFTQLNEALALCIFHQVTCGLCVAEKLKLIHRDIKPANIFICNDGRAKLADFGIARSTEESRTQLTMQGALVGSPLYMSPEQVFGESDLDVRCDIYAMGCVLYYMLTGSAPYTTTGHVQEILHMHCEAPIPNIQDTRTDVSAQSAAIISKCLAKSREDRYDSAKQLLAATEEALRTIGLNIESIESEFGPVSPSAQKATVELSAAMRAQIPEETISQNLNILNAGNSSDAINSTDATIAANLNSDDVTIASDLSNANDDMTIAADFNPDSAHAQETLATQSNKNNPFTDAHDNIPTSKVVNDPEAETAPTPNNFVDTLLAGNNGGNSDGKAATDITIAERPAEKQSITGDIHAAMNCPWISLMPSNPGEPMSFMLFAKNDILMGKLRDAPIDLCLRNYPVPIHKAACQRISRQHLRITYDLHGKNACLMDVGSGNGTLYEGMSLPPNKPQELNASHSAHVIVADAVELNITSIPCSGIPVHLLDGAPESTKTALFGIDTHNAYDAITITRPSNRPELAYAMVLRQVSIGDANADISVPGADAASTYEFALYNGYWIWRIKSSDGSNAHWQALTNGSTFQIANRHLIARPGCYQDFH